MLVAPGPMEVVQAIIRRRREALAKAMAACAIACSLWRAEGRQLVAHPVQRLAHAGHVAMAEDRPDPAEDRHDRPSISVFWAAIADERLGHGEADRGHGNLPVGRLP